MQARLTNLPSLVPDQRKRDLAKKLDEQIAELKTMRNAILKPAPGDRPEVVSIVECYLKAGCELVWGLEGWELRGENLQIPVSAEVVMKLRLFSVEDRMVLFSDYTAVRRMIENEPLNFRQRALRCHIYWSYCRQMGMEAVDLFGLQIQHSIPGVRWKYLRQSWNEFLRVETCIVGLRCAGILRLLGLTKGSRRIATRCLGYLELHYPFGFSAAV